tara:strand:- start:3524 stop:3775 length:252 start_codon:yes stop_codon:yes gene_type:complete
MSMMCDDDDDLDIGAPTGWRKRQIANLQKNLQESVDGYLEDARFKKQVRNDTLEEVAKEFEKMRGFGQDTMDSFCIFVRNMKR